MCIFVGACCVCVCVCNARAVRESEPLEISRFTAPSRSVPASHHRQRPQARIPSASKTSESVAVPAPPPTNRGLAAPCFPPFVDPPSPSAHPSFRAWPCCTTPTEQDLTAPKGSESGASILYHLPSEAFIAHNDVLGDFLPPTPHSLEYLQVLGFFRKWTMRINTAIN